MPLLSARWLVVWGHRAFRRSIASFCCGVGSELAAVDVTMIAEAARIAGTRMAHLLCRLQIPPSGQAVKLKHRALVEVNPATAASRRRRAFQFRRNPLPHAS